MRWALTTTRKGTEMSYHVFTAYEIKQMILAAILERTTYFEGEAKLEDRKGAANQNKIMLYQFGRAELNDLASAITKLPDGEMRGRGPT